MRSVALLSMIRVRRRIVSRLVWSALIRTITVVFIVDVVIIPWLIIVIIIVVLRACLREQVSSRGPCSAANAVVLHDVILTERTMTYQALDPSGGLRLSSDDNGAAWVLTLPKGHP